MGFSKYKQKKFKKLVNKGIDYANKYLSQELVQDELVNNIYEVVILKHRIQKEYETQIEALNKALEEEKSKPPRLYIVEYSNRVIRQPKEEWKQNMVYDLLIKTFNSYDFKKARYDISKKEAICTQYSINPVRLTDQVNFFINNSIKSYFDPNENDKYKLLSDKLFSIYDLFKWKYRSIIKEGKVDLSKIPDNHKEIVEKIFKV